MTPTTTLSDTATFESRASSAASLPCCPASMCRHPPWVPPTSDVTADEQLTDEPADNSYLARWTLEQLRCAIASVPHQMNAEALMNTCDSTILSAAQILRLVAGRCVWTCQIGGSRTSSPC